MKRATTSPLMYQRQIWEVRGTKMAKIISSTFAALILMLSLAGQSWASVTIYPDRLSFTAANPGLSTEDFENNRTSLNIANFPGPLNSTSTAIFGGSILIFAPGDILPGIEFRENAPEGLLFLDVGKQSVTSARLGTNRTRDILDIFIYGWWRQRGWIGPLRSL